jgi:hypothetical protein
MESTCFQTVVCLHSWEWRSAWFSTGVRARGSPSPGTQTGRASAGGAPWQMSSQEGEDHFHVHESCSEGRAKLVVSRVCGHCGPGQPHDGCSSAGDRGPALDSLQSSVWEVEVNVSIHVEEVRSVDHAFCPRCCSKLTSLLDL